MRDEEEECVSDGELRMDCGSVMHFRNLNKIPVISIVIGIVMPSLVSSRTRTKFKHELGSYNVV